MNNGTILIVIGRAFSETDLSRRLEALRGLRARAAILVVGEMPDFPYVAFGAPMYGTPDIPREWQQEVAENRAALQAKAEAAERLLAQHDVSGEVTLVSSEPARIADAVARRAMLCDLALVGEDLRHPDYLFQQVVHGILFASPIGVVLNDRDPQASLAAKTVFVAWNTRLPSARAVHHALPILRQADSVIVGVVDPVATEYRDGEDPGVDVAKWLAHHGCAVSVQQIPSGGRGVGEVILDRSKACGADLIVMGSFGHSRTRETLFGGTTRTILAQNEQAVFLAH